MAKQQKPGYEGTVTPLIELSPALSVQYADPNPLVRLIGAGPSGARCKDCAYLGVKKAGGSRFYKCALRGDLTSGAGTDHRQKWNACARYRVDMPPCGVCNTLEGVRWHLRKEGSPAALCPECHAKSAASRRAAKI